MKDEDRRTQTQQLRQELSAIREQITAEHTRLDRITRSATILGNAIKLLAKQPAEKRQL